MNKIDILAVEWIEFMSLGKKEVQDYQMIDK